MDASAVLALLAGEPAAAEVAELIAAGEAVLSSVNLAEVVDVMVRRGQHAEDVVRERVGWLVVGGLTVGAADAAIGMAAGALRATHYRRRVAEVSLGDCFALATALEIGVPVATSDAVLAAVARAVGARVTGLPNSDGLKP